MGISLFIVFILIIFLYFKTKRIKNQNLHERLVADNQNFKIKGKDVKASRKERINYDERDIDLRREKSNSIVISKSILAEMKNEKRFLEFN